MFGQVALLVFAALLGPLLAAGRRPVVPVLVGELAAGALIGRTGFRLLDPTAQPLPAFYAIGFAMLMVSAGTHVDLSSAQLRESLSRAGLALLISLVVGLLSGAPISAVLRIDHSVLFGILLAGSSAAVIFPSIEERALRGSGIAFLTAWVLLADGLTVLLMPLTLVGPSHLLLALVGDALIIATGAAILWVAPRAIRSEAVATRIREGFRQSRQRGWALQLRLSILVLLGLAAIAEGTRASLLVAGFVTGIVLAQLGQPERLVFQLSGLANGFFVPAFFVLLGATLDLRQLATDPVAIALGVMLAAGAVSIHLLAAALTGRDRRFTLGLLASAQLGLPAAAAALGISSHALSPALRARWSSAAASHSFPPRWPRPSWLADRPRHRTRAEPPHPRTKNERPPGAVSSLVGAGPSREDRGRGPDALPRGPGHGVAQLGGPEGFARPQPSRRGDGRASRLDK